MDSTPPRFPFLSLPVELQLLVALHWTQHRLCLPSASLCARLHVTFSTPDSLARRALRRYGTASPAIQSECRRKPANLTVIRRIIRLARPEPSDLVGPLYLAARSGNASLVCLLMESGAPDNDEAILPTLAAAVKRGHCEAVELLLSRGTDLKACYSSPLLLAARKGRTHIARLLIDAGHTQAHLDASLRVACLRNHPDVARLLLERGASADAFGGEVLIRACARGRTDIVRLLVAHTPSIDARNAALVAACANGHFEIVEMLLDSGADVCARDNAPIKAVCRRKPAPLDVPDGADGDGHAARIVRLLLDRGADPRAALDTPLRIACRGTSCGVPG